MRIAATLTICVLLPCALWAQTETAAPTGHFEGWPASLRWGTDRQSFEATTVGIRPRIGLLTVAENGFGWRRAFTDSEEGSFFRWEEILVWCWAPETLLIRTGEVRSARYYDISQGDLAAIVDDYLRKYAAQVEVSGSEQECTTAALRLPDDARDAREVIIELLEAASSENR